MKIDKYYHLYSRKLEVIFEEIPNPVRRGRWIAKAYPWDACSLCGTYVDGYYCWRYCPYCGAKMDGGTED